jgi:hypothetical protein
MDEVVTGNLLVEDRYRDGVRFGLSVYGGSLVSAVTAGLWGRSTPGFCGIIMYLALGWLSVEAQKRFGVSLSKTICFLVFIGIVVIPPTRLLGISFRQLDAAPWLEATAQALIVGWMFLGVALMAVKIFAKKTKEQPVPH